MVVCCQPACHNWHQRCHSKFGRFQVSSVIPLRARRSWPGPRLAWRSLKGAQLDEEAPAESKLSLSSLGGTVLRQTFRRRSTLSSCLISSAQAGTSRRRPLFNTPHNVFRETVTRQLSSSVTDEPGELWTKQNRQFPLTPALSMN